MPEIQAIDVLYHPTRGTCPPSPADCLEKMDAAAVELALVSQCKQWSCERQWMCIDTRLEDVVRFTRHSTRFIGLAGYNPFDITESLREIEVAVGLGFRGVYLHATSFGLPLGDARLYPLFAKAAEMRIPVVVQLGIAEPILRRTVARICRDLPELALLLIHPRPSAADMEALASDNEYLGFVLDAPGLELLCRRDGTFFQGWVFGERCTWGTNGASFPDALQAAHALPVPADTLARFLRYNAERVFTLGHTAQARIPGSLSNEIVTAER